MTDVLIQVRVRIRTITSVTDGAAPKISAFN